MAPVFGMAIALFRHVTGNHSDPRIAGSKSCGHLHSYGGERT
jgi:hypothetical protein